MRSFVSFLADVPSASDPPGHEVAVVLSEMLDGAGHPQDGPEDRHGRGWGLRGALEGGSIDCVVQRADAGDERWLTEISIRRTGWGKFAAKLKPEHAAALKAWALALRDALAADPRFEDVRWAGVEDWFD